MSNLFLIDGAAGTGKTDLLELISKKYGASGHSNVIKKHTTRPHRSKEKKLNLSLDLNFLSESDFNKKVNVADGYCYEYGDFKYGFSKKELDKSIKENNNTFIIIRDAALINKIVSDYSKIRVVKVFIHADITYVQQRLSADGYDDSEIKFRLKRQKLVSDDYIRQPHLYDEIIINNSNKNDFHRLIDQLLFKYSSEELDCLSVSPVEKHPLPLPLIGFKSKMSAMLNKTEYNNNVFLMMKFRDNNKLISDFIIEELRKSGFNGVRADQPNWNITDNVYNPIAVLYCCQYGIALFDEAEEGNVFSPNVAYELGMMHLLRKRCIILRHTSLPEMPFDLIKDLHRSYSSDLEVKSHISKWLSEVSES